MCSDFIKYFGLSQSMRFWVAHETIHQWIGVGYDDFKRTLEHYANAMVIEQMEKHLNSKGIPDNIVTK